jgi:hypothetical protein
MTLKQAEKGTCANNTEMDLVDASKERRIGAT